MPLSPFPAAAAAPRLGDERRLLVGRPRGRRGRHRRLRRRRPRVGLRPPVREQRAALAAAPGRLCLRRDLQPQRRARTAARPTSSRPPATRSARSPTTRAAAVVGRAGASPPATVPVRIFTEDQDTGARSTIGARVTDETDVGTPTGSSALTFVAPLALAQGASAILLSAPGQLKRQCVRADRAARAQEAAAVLQPLLRRRSRPRTPRRARNRRRGRRVGRPDRAHRARRLQAAPPST